MASDITDWPDIMDPHELNDRIAQTWERTIVYTGGSKSPGVSIPAHITDERGYEAGDKVVTYMSMVHPDVYCVLLTPRS